MTRARIPSRTAFEAAAAYVRDLGLDDRGFSVSADGTITIHPVNKPGHSDAYDKWQRMQSK